MANQNPANATTVITSSPQPVASVQLALRAIMITAGIVVLAVIWPVAALNRYREISGSTLPYQLRPEDPALVLTGLLLCALILSFVFTFRPLRHYHSIDEMQTGFRKVVADSYFGQGHFAGWTMTHPQLHLRDLEYPDYTDVVTLADIAEPVRAESTVRRLHPEQDVISTSTETVDYLVKRRDSWWKIAEALFDDAARWEEIRTLNLGSDVADGVTIEENTALRSGWVVQVPVT